MTAEQRREQILDVTHAIVDVEGFHAATPNRIAREAGINRSLIYQLFGDPAKLFVALIDREAGRAGEQFVEAISGLGEPSEDNQPLVRAFDGVLAAVDAHTATWRLFLFPPQGAPPELHERLAQSQTVVRDFLQGELLRLNPKLQDPEYTARILYAAGRELLQLRLSDPDTATPERLRTFVHGLRASLREQT
ncbi:TetR/AcrR family transcriptional regulator [Mycobacterium asiaticum]|uniref:TetR family transcriptional regulator n=1 Tax=Mycobacterium asiaticum TaxID=1790 RepID=A0A1A3CLW4_MYCAS|nr:TetR/AcrR family transcriptional regulator [Mycobacterium asiaticum]OBI87950.1 TetR family transcriptional regulator [Mycobacterium asiaticum]OBJ65779.1 TetR family transcriptional regulator [Mycobacterium asiaticum]OBJ83766.1 TetR family transcriptional regulator [Mycobacterium asiaticum]ORA17931.1 TetR family transcriptional regulator [Mycobacterium asiaticum DSM 44297]